MSVRPKDLNASLARQTVLHCGECVVDYSSDPSDYEWMFPSDVICCQGCGTSELALEEKTLIDA